MRCWSWSLPSGPGYCAGFSWEKDSVCRSCYAHQGHYLWGHVQRAQQIRWQWWRNASRQERVQVLSIAIQKRTKKNPYFRVFDSGDFWEVEDVYTWTEIARACPETRFWVSTRVWRSGLFHEALTELHRLPNVCVRLSGLEIDQPRVPPYLSAFPQAHVSSTGPGCPKQTHGSCQAAACRICWDKTVPTVEYRLHGHAVKFRLTPAA